MGESTRKRRNPPPAPPIAPEALKALYTEYLEVQLEVARLDNQAARVRGLEQVLGAKIQALAPGSNLEEWELNLKDGSMRRRPRPLLSAPKG